MGTPVSTQRVRVRVRRPVLARFGTQKVLKTHPTLGKNREKKTLKENINFLLQELLMSFFVLLLHKEKQIGSSIRSSVSFQLTSTGR